MNEPQVWTLIGVFATALLAMITFTTQIMWRSINSRFDSLRDEMKAEFTSIRTESATQFAAVRAESTTQFAAVRTQITHLDRDVQAISKRVFPE